MHIIFGHARKHFHGVMDIPSSLLVPFHSIPSCPVKVNHNGINSNDITQHIDVHKLRAIKWKRLQTAVSQTENVRRWNTLQMLYLSKCFGNSRYSFNVFAQSVQYKWVCRACLRVKSREHFRLFDVTVTGFHWFYWFYRYYFAVGGCCRQLLNAVASVIDWNPIVKM